MDDPLGPIGLEAALASGAPTDVLVPCDVAGMLDAAQMRAHADVLEVTGAALARVEVTNWRGRAADGFADVLAPEPARWRSAADGFLAGAVALEGFVASIAPARATASEAVTLYQRYLQTAADAAALVDVAPAPPLSDRMQVGAHIVQQQTAAAASGDTGASLTSDADSLRRQAMSMLAAARRAVQAAGDIAVDTLARASENAPRARRFWEANIRPADIIGTGHAALDGVGMIPAAGVVPDAVNATWYAVSGDGRNAAISATGAIPVLGAMFIGGRWVSKAVRPMEKLTDEVANPMPERLYISGTKSQGNMTPRPQDATGLSSVDNLNAPIFRPGSKVQEIDPRLLKELEVAGPDGPKGHYSIRPQDPSGMSGWMRARGRENTHPYTQELIDSVINDFRIPRSWT